MKLTILYLNYLASFRFVDNCFNKQGNVYKKMRDAKEARKRKQKEEEISNESDEEKQEMVNKINT